MPILECEQAAKEIQPGDEVAIDFATGTITDKTTGKQYQAQPFPPFMQELMNQGGLVEYTKQKIAKE